MLYLRKGTSEGLLDVWSKTRTYGDTRVAVGFTELEVRRFFRERAIEAAKKAVGEMLADVQPHSG